MLGRCISGGLAGLIMVSAVAGEFRTKGCVPPPVDIPDIVPQVKSAVRDKDICKIPRSV